jgi:hypothetical protein
MVVYLRMRDPDGTPIVFADCASGTCYRMEYREAKESAEKMPIEHLKAFLEGCQLGLKSELDELSPLIRPFAKLASRIYDFIEPDPRIMAFGDVLEDRVNDS